MDSVSKGLAKGTASKQKKTSQRRRNHSPSDRAKPQQTAIPEAHTPRRVFSESDTQKLIIAFLRTHKIFCWRNNTTGTYDVVRKTFRTLSGVGALKGVSDILGVLPDGRFLGIEVKAQSGTVSLEQREFIANVNRCGGLAFVARSLDDVKRELPFLA